MGDPEGVIWIVARAYPGGVRSGGVRSFVHLHDFLTTWAMYRSRRREVTSAGRLGRGPMMDGTLVREFIFLRRRLRATSILISARRWIERATLFVSLAIAVAVGVLVLVMISATATGVPSVLGLCGMSAMIV